LVGIVAVVLVAGVAHDRAVAAPGRRDVRSRRNARRRLLLGAALLAYGFLRRPDRGRIPRPPQRCRGPGFGPRRPGRRRAQGPGTGPGVGVDRAGRTTLTRVPARRT